MKIFTSGVSERQISGLSKAYNGAEVIDVSDQYQDILALCADIIVINIDNTTNEIVSIIREFEKETCGVDGTRYIYVNNTELEQWIPNANGNREALILGVDFDGTLSFGKWPNCGPANDGLVEFLKRRKYLGDKIILWTCREGEDLVRAVSWCETIGLKFDAVNDNLPEVVERYGVNSRKISCDYYIDDKAVAENIYKLLEED